MAGGAQTRKTVQIITEEEYDTAVRLNPDFSPLAAAGDYRTGRELLADAGADAQLSVSAAAFTPYGRAVLGRLVSLARAVRDRFRERAADFSAACAAAAGGGGGPLPTGGGLGGGTGPGAWAASSNPRTGGVASAAAGAAECRGGYWAGHSELPQWAAAEAAADSAAEGGLVALVTAEAAVERPLRTGAMVLVERGPADEPAQLAEIGARRWWAAPIMRRFWVYGHRVRHPPPAARA